MGIARSSFTFDQREGFLRRVNRFLASQSKSANAAATMKMPGASEMFGMDGVFDYDAMIFAVKSPEHCVDQIRKATNSNYDGVRLTVQYGEPATLAMNFLVTCALKPKRSERVFRAWIIVEVERIKSNGVKLR